MVYNVFNKYEITHSFGNIIKNVLKKITTFSTYSGGKEYGKRLKRKPTPFTHTVVEKNIKLLVICYKCYLM